MVDVRGIHLNRQYTDGLTTRPKVRIPADPRRGSRILMYIRGG